MILIEFYLLLACVIGSTYSSNSNYLSQSNVYTSEAFFVPIERKWFSEFTLDDNLEYSASLRNMPDLPRWMFCRHTNGSNDAFLYGAPEEPGTIQIEIIALNKNNYKTSRKIMIFNVERRSDKAQYEVEMKFLNLNVEDMFRADRLTRLVEVFRGHLWKDNEIIYITKVVSSLDVGGRLPLNPREKEGVVVRIGGTKDFSRDLEDLQREVQPLRNRIPCPRDYKRTSVEHLFRRRNFISDWCSFRLISEEKEGAAESSRGWSDPAYSSISLTSDDFRPQSINLPRRDFLFDFIVSIIIPSVVVGLLSTALTCIMCCNREGLVKRNEETSRSALEGCNHDSGVQLNQYSSIQRATNQIRQLAAKRDSLPRSGSTPGSSLPLSRTGSPSSTLPKTSTPRPSSRTGTLRGLMLPPPPPYTPHSVGSRRNTITQSAQ